jgi:hypothetical protein
VSHRPEVFDGPWLRSQLKSHANYVASNDFPDLWKWEKCTGTTPNKLRVNGDGEPEDVFCKVVGIISDERPYLETHGNYNAKFNPDMRKSKLQFTLKNPNDADFGSDFELAYRRLENVQDKIAIGPNRSWFLMDGAMRFSFPLWEIKVRLFTTKKIPFFAYLLPLWLRKSSSMRRMTVSIPRNSSFSYAHIVTTNTKAPEDNELTKNYHMRSDLMEMKLAIQDSYQVRSDFHKAT